MSIYLTFFGLFKFSYNLELDSAFRKGGKLSPDIGNLREKMIIGILKK
ncbi:MAG: hypothetical protein ACTSQS_19035 [Promethearchaeota archaeon]